MSTELHQLDDPYELLEIVSLRSSQWVFIEEGDDLGAEIIEPLHAIPKYVFSVVVVTAVPENLAAPEELNEFLENIPAGLSLNNRKLRANLPLQSHLRTSIDRDAEAALPINETHNPSWVIEPFLLIFRRGLFRPLTFRIVTAIHITTLLIRYDENG